MNIDYFFPVFAEDDAQKFFTKFFKSKFYQKYNSVTNKTSKKDDKNSGEKQEKNESKVFFVCQKDDAKNLEYLSKQALIHPEYKVFVVDKNFSYNDAFSIALNYFKGDFVLLGDMKISKLDLVFEKCLQKKEKCSVVHVIKKRTGFKGFFKNLFIKFYNFFIKLFTGKKDRFNVVSLGLIDKNIIELLQVLPTKSCYLKNTKELKGFETRSIYIDSKTKTYKKSYATKTSSLVTVISSFCVFIGLTLAIILLNIFLAVLPIVNILLAMSMFSCIVLCLLFLPKHVFDIRNSSNKISNFEVKEIN